MRYFGRVLIAPPRLITAGLIALVLSLGLVAPIAAQTDYVGLRRQEANQGNARAQLTLGFMYANGFDVPQDYAEAAKWFRRAADQGNVQAGVELGSMYDKGHQLILGIMYFDGEGLPQDYVKAHMWINLAGTSFGNSTMSNQAVKRRDAVTAKMTGEQIAETQKLAREWKP